MEKRNQNSSISLHSHISHLCLHFSLLLLMMCPLLKAIFLIKAITFLFSCRILNLVTRQGATWANTLGSVGKCFSNVHWENYSLGNCVFLPNVFGDVYFCPSFFSVHMLYLMFDDSFTYI